MSIEVYVVFAILLLAWYFLNSDKKPSKKEEIKEIPTLDEVLNKTDEMYRKSTESICEMYNKSKKELNDIHKTFMKEIKGNTKTTSKGASKC